MFMFPSRITKNPVNQVNFNFEKHIDNILYIFENNNTHLRRCVRKQFQKKHPLIQKSATASVTILEILAICSHQSIFDYEEVTLTT